MADLKNESEKYSALIANINSGQLKIPQFQRKFVWDIKQSAKLVDSIIKGFPIGTFIFWRTTERLRAIREIGGQSLPESKNNEHITYVLDGQQRITSIYVILNGLTIKQDDSSSVDYSNIFIDLDSPPDGDIVVIDPENYSAESLIKVTTLINGTRKDLKKYDEKYDEKLDLYKLKLTSYDFSVITLRDAPIDTATEVFTRLNVGGKALTLFEIMVAKTYEERKSFDLSVKYEELLSELSECQYETISDATILQTVAVLLTKECTRKTILQLPKKEFVEIWDSATDAIKTTVDFFIDQFGVKVSKILPYNALIVPFAYFFYKTKRKPNGITLKRLTDYFWRASLGNRFSSSVESKIAQDVIRFDDFIAGKSVKYEWSIDIEPDSIINNGWFSTGRSYIKAILTILAAQAPKSFNTNSDVRIQNSWLKIASSKNYHHFFPKSYMDKKQKNYELWQVNNIVNITIVDDFLNKNIIRSNPPGKYIKDFQGINDELESSLKSHLIHDIEEFGILENNYAQFLNARAKAISDEIKKRIIAGNENPDAAHYPEHAEISEDE